MANTSNLTLFYYPISYYSQKALLCLHEKQLPFKRHVVNLSNGETYAPWFMKLNPKGQVPVLKDGDTVIDDSAEIAAYLDKHYGGQLLQPDIQTDFGQRVKHFVQLLDDVNVPVLTFGGIIFPEVIHKSHLPSFIIKSSRERVMANQFASVFEVGMKQAEKEDSSMKDIYEQKKANMGKMLDDMKNKDAVLRERSKTRDILHEVEKELRKTQEENSPDKQTWLCGEDFTLADICLCNLLTRLYFVGYSGAMWENNLLPNVDAYFEKVKKRQSYKDVVAKVHSPSFIVGMMARKYMPYIGIGGLLVGVGIGVGIYLYSRRK
ncbi:hypothetical protein CAPTEDRAFT_166789 [Capitella teleta]|uniref:GST N-terminal domain-containing protein n=1 Tax=Capitella teleta TaxID=283909 RepID=R7TKP4_CAPTE|nr:hypothetical protein CAPTEDRAFT_166789 [Capitella teleta]|eukprot:ELT91680.1 hypothetical protein CAPTEDRAFT_166789 [Capitella teleta]